MGDYEKKLLVNIVNIRNLTNIQVKHNKDYITLDIYENRDFMPRYPQNVCSTEREAPRRTSDQHLRAL